MTQLSPAAQAVMDAALGVSVADHIALSTAQALRLEIAAALCAVVKQCKYSDDFGDAFLIADEVEAIAAELEAVHG